MPFGRAGSTPVPGTFATLSLPVTGPLSPTHSRYVRRKTVHPIQPMEETKKHILIGSGLDRFFLSVLGGVAAAAYLPGFSGEVGRMCLAWITSPFLMETAIFFLALTLLFAINAWRRNQEGDDWVTLDENGQAQAR